MTTPATRRSTTASTTPRTSTMAASFVLSGRWEFSAICDLEQPECSAPVTVGWHESSSIMKLSTAERVNESGEGNGPMESIDHYTVRTLPTLMPEAGRAGPTSLPVDRVTQLRQLFAAQLQSRHLDFAARWLQSRG